MTRSNTLKVVRPANGAEIFRCRLQRRRHASVGILGLAGVLTVAAALNGAAAADAVGFRLSSPYEFGGHQHKVQLHTHTINSDGDHEPQWVMQEYAKRGYTAIAITDHDYPDRTTPSLDDPGGHSIIHISGVEYSANERNRSWNHMLGINIKTIHHAEGIHNRQAQINKAHVEGGFAYLCHPYDEHIHRRGWDDEDVISLIQGYDGIEIYNGRSYHEPGGRDYPYKVDLALTSGRRIHVIAVDDFHRNPQETMDRGYVVVNSHVCQDEVTREEIIAALQSGNYFSAGRVSPDHPTSPWFTDIDVQGDTVTVSTDKPSNIEFITARHNYYREGPNFTHMQEGVTSAGYTASHDDQFIRIKATFREGDQVSYAWSNPIYVEAEAD